VGDSSSGETETESETTGPTRRLTLLRHGRAASPAEASDDHDRALVESGRQDLVATLAQEAVRADLPDRVLCSDARRTRESAACVMDVLALDAGRLVIDERLYLASPEALLQIVAEQDAGGVEHLMIVGHNPGLEMFAAALDVRARQAMPTASLCRFARRSVAGTTTRTVARLLFETRPPR